ncbi:TD and POZ domain-containing protein 5 [Caerostris darwini]|uniref:TD and POZ domain-containing protein 5 n=1 Tax=Caerostris darwini TaxID=1538125 RepID=A0AAV4WHY5_9ARAC|nr:TD and POZ domain-containing protein 5 [Caerostris darwini]
MYSFQWRIAYFSHCWQKDGECITSPSFIFIDKNGIQTKWTLRMFPRIKNFVNVSLSRDDTDGPEFVQLQYSFELLSKNEVIKKVPGMCAQFRKRSCYAHHELINCDELFLYKRSEYIPSDILTVRCILWNPGDENVTWRCFALSQIKTTQRTFVWNIDGFSQFQLHHTNCITMRSTTKEILMTLTLFLTEGQNMEEIINININPSNEYMKFLTFRIHVCDPKSKVPNLLTKKEICSPFLKKEYSFPLPISKTSIVQKADEYLLNDVLTLWCVFVFPTGCISNEIETIRFTSVGSATKNVIIDQQLRPNMEEAMKYLNFRNKIYKADASVSNSK